MTTPAAVQVPPLITIPGVELLATGEWNLSTGTATFTTDDLASAVEAAQCPAVGGPIIKLGHTDGRFTATHADGEPAIGRVTNLEQTQAGNKLTGDLAGMPGWLAAISGSAYPQRSIEGAWDWVCQIGHTHPFVITAVALLGVAPPGVGVIKDLDDVAALYGIQATIPEPAQVRSRWQLQAAGGPVMPAPASAAAVTTDDVRRAYYGSGVPMSRWITAIQLDPPQLIVADDSDDKVYRVPYKIKGSDVTFADPVEVEVEYVDVKAALLGAQLAAGTLAVFASAEDSRAGDIVMAWSASTQLKNMGDSPTAAAIKKMFALPGSTKSDSKLPHHACATGGTVGGPDLAGCQAAIAAINGSRGGLTGVSAADLKKAYNHLAGHVRDLGGEPAEYGGPSASADPGQPPAPGGTGAHAGKGGGHMRGAREVDFTDEMLAQARAKLGLAEDAEITAEQIMAALLADPAPAQAAAPARLPQGVLAVDQAAWEEMEQRARAGEEALRRMRTAERDTVIAAAVHAGKFSVAQVERYNQLWDGDPETTRAVIAGMKPGVVPTADVGQPGFGDADADAEYEALFGTPAR